jgi:hypothetical protein
VVARHAPDEAISRVKNMSTLGDSAAFRIFPNAVLFSATRSQLPCFQGAFTAKKQRMESPADAISDFCDFSSDFTFRKVD